MALEREPSLNLSAKTPMDCARVRLLKWGRSQIWFVERQIHDIAAFFCFISGTCLHLTVKVICLRLRNQRRCLPPIINITI